VCEHFRRFAVALTPSFATHPVGATPHRGTRERTHKQTEEIMSKVIRYAGAILALAVSGLVSAQGTVEKPAVHIAVGGKAALYYLPLTITERLGYFKDEGLDVRISDFKGGAPALRAVVGGSADVVSGAYEHTISMAARGQKFQAFVLQGRAPQISIGVSMAKVPHYKSPRDLRGLKIGVSAPGSSTNMFADYVLQKGGLGPKDVSFVGVGTGAAAIAAIQSGEVDAISNVDPVMTMLEKQGTVKVIFTSRTPEGTKEVFGGPMPAACLYAPIEFVRKNPKTAQALANAVVRALLWLDNATPQQILATVPEAYQLGDKAMYLFAYDNIRGAISKDGLIPKAGAETALKVLKTSNPKVDYSKVNLAETYTNQFAQNALKKYRK
jgi:NitT/TauT family transport system substrate-binding protein